MKQEEERLRREKLEFERQRSGFDDERDRIGKLGLEVQKRSREIEELCSVSHCFANVNCEAAESFVLKEHEGSCYTSLCEGYVMLPRNILRKNIGSENSRRLYFDVLVLSTDVTSTGSPTKRAGRVIKVESLRQRLHRRRGRRRRFPLTFCRKHL